MSTSRGFGTSYRVSKGLVLGVLALLFLGLVTGGVFAEGKLSKETSVKAEAPQLTVPVAAGVGGDNVLQNSEELQARDAFARLQAGESLTADEKELVERHWATLVDAWGGEEPRHGDPLDATGGPDASGYSYVDNQPSDSVVYGWIELKGDPGATWLQTSAFNSVDDGYTTTPIPLGITFPFYSTPYTTAYLGTNGSVMFSNPISSGYGTSGCLPRTSFTGRVLFPFLDDMHLQRGGITSGNNVIGYKNFGDYTVIQYDSIGRFSTTNTGSFNFQVILWNTGLIKYQYRRMVYNTAS